ncbi:MAG: VTC domain-containing protein [Eggerthellaceae bacterium]|jgi:hypothetical protein
MSYQENFKRKEMKYLLNEQQYKRIQSGLTYWMELNQFGRYGVRSVYYDTPNHMLAALSLEHPYYKEKLRLRTYIDGTNDDIAYVELKKKIDGVVYKRRLQMSQSGACLFLTGTSYMEAKTQYPLVDDFSLRDESWKQEVQIAQEIEAFLLRYKNLLPSMVVTAQRSAWQPLYDLDYENGLRITFDRDVCYENLRVSEKRRNTRVSAIGRIIPADKTIMEVKSLGSLPLWLVRLLDVAQAYPTSISKYGQAYIISEGFKSHLHKMPHRPRLEMPQTFVPRAHTATI